MEIDINDVPWSDEFATSSVVQEGGSCFPSPGWEAHINEDTRRAGESTVIGTSEASRLSPGAGSPGRSAGPVHLLLE